MKHKKHLFKVKFLRLFYRFIGWNCACSVYLLRSQSDNRLNQQIMRVCMVTGRVRGRDHLTVKICKVFVLGRYFSWNDTNESKMTLKALALKKKNKSRAYFWVEPCLIISWAGINGQSKQRLLFPVCITRWLLFCCPLFFVLLDHIRLI